MSSLRKCLKQPTTYLVMLALAGLSFLVDAGRSPGRQFSAQAYIALVHAYQQEASPRISRFVRCRYHPTCSEYSIEAVQKFGILKGMELSARRLWRCRSGVPLATPDPVP
jgi:uncharacterized protein